MQAISPMINPKEKGRIIEDGCIVKSAEGRRIKMIIRPIRDPINDPSRLPMADSIKSDKAINHLLAPKAMKMPTRYALRRIALTITSEMARTDKTNVMDTTINLTIPLVSQARMLNSVTATAVMKTTIAICNLRLLRPFVINQDIVVR